MKYYERETKEVITELHSSREGLSEIEAKKRLGIYGQNVITKQAKKSKIRMFIGQYRSLLMQILIVAAIVSYAIGHYIDAIVILFIVLLNGIIGFLQEYKAEEIIEKLRKSLRYKVRVMRAGKQQEIDSEYLVPGDIMIIDSGDRILADARIIHNESLTVNESILSGESFPIEKTDKKISFDAVITDRKNMVYAGTSVVGGKALAIVTATGGKSEFGKLAQLVQESQDTRTPLEEKLEDFSKRISILILGLVIVVFFAGIAMGYNRTEMFLTMISLAVGAIPEGLPAIIIITLAVAIRQMYRTNTLVRKLPAAEALGRATVICTDKTGTLTEEELRVSEICTHNKTYDVETIKRIDPTVGKLLEVGLLCNNARDEDNSILGDPTEVALIGIAKKYGFLKKAITEKNPRVKEYAFDSERKMATIIRRRGTLHTSYVKGAPNVILSRCTKEYISGRISLISKHRREKLEKSFMDMESRGLRVIGIAFRNISKVDQKQAENTLVLIGFVGMIDPPRKEVRAAIAEAQNAGIEVKIITGDSALTTVAVASKLGLKGDYIIGEDLEKLSEEEWARTVQKKNIFARVTPKQKLKIVEILKLQRETVAVTGDGVNDILALKKADVGISMGVRGSDVARDSSDIVLLDDNFASIVGAIRQGRRVFDNMKKSISFLLAVNAANIFIIIWSLLRDMPLPFIPLAILWMNLITDSLPALALAVEKEEKDIMRRGPSGQGILSEIWGTILFAGILNFLVVTLVYEWALDAYTLEVARTMAITVSVFFALFFIFSCKSKEILTFKRAFNNKWIIYTVLLSSVVHLTAVYTQLGTLFEYVPLDRTQLCISILLGIIPLIFFELQKYLRSILSVKIDDRRNLHRRKVYKRTFVHNPTK